MEEKPQEDINFVVLLATVIRHRVWVYWSLAVGVLAATAVLIVLPLLGVNLIGSTRMTAQAVVRTLPVPAEAQGSVNFDFLGQFQGAIRDLSLVGGVYHETFDAAEPGTLSKAAYNGRVKRFVSSNLVVTLDVKTASLVLSLGIAETDQEKGTKFLAMLTQKIRESVRNFAVPLIEKAVANLAVGRTPTGELGAQTLAQYELRSRALQGLLADPDFPLTLVGSVEVVDETPKVSKPLVGGTIIFGSLVLGLLLTFLAEAVVRTRRDPDQVELLRKAWKNK